MLPSLVVISSRSRCLKSLPLRTSPLRKPHTINNFHTPKNGKFYPLQNQSLPHSLKNNPGYTLPASPPPEPCSLNTALYSRPINSLREDPCPLPTLVPVPNRESAPSSSPLSSR